MGQQSKQKFTVAAVGGPKSLICWKKFPQMPIHLILEQVVGWRTGHKPVASAKKTTLCIEQSALILRCTGDFR
jgi:hypothetical protein